MPSVQRTNPVQYIPPTVESPFLDISDIQECNVKIARSLVQQGWRILHIANVTYWQVHDGHPNGGYVRRQIKYVVGKPEKRAPMMELVCPGESADEEER